MVSQENRTGLYIAIPIYFTILACIAGLGWRKTQGLKDSSHGHHDAVMAHYLAGRSLGPFTMMGTVFATAFSGYTVVGVPNEAFATGWASMRWFMTGLGIFAAFIGALPRLRRFSLLRNHHAPTDFISDRYRSHTLRLAVVFCQLVPSLIYLSAQVISIKSVINGIFELDPDSNGWTIAIFAVILVAEWVGGLVCVASTDTFQGIVMTVSFILLPAMIHKHFGGWQDLDPETFPRPALYQNPSAKTQWFMWNFGMINASFFVLPIWMQRIYAARNNLSLKLGLVGFALGTWFTWLPGIFIGTMGIKILADAGVTPITTPFAAVVEQIMDKGGFSRAVGVIAFTASLAAIMSTADSVVISISQLVTAEIVHPIVPTATPNTIALVGRLISAVSIAIGLLVGIQWNDGLSDLVRVQSGIGLQCVPTFFVALFSWGPTDCHPWSLAAGSVAGCILTFTLYFNYIKQNDDPRPLDAGVTACFFNCVLVVMIEFGRRLYTGTWSGTVPYPTIATTSKRTDDDIKNNNDDALLWNEMVPFEDRPTVDKIETCHFGSHPLTSGMVWRAMEGSWEPLTNPFLIVFLFFLMLAFVPAIPEGYPPLLDDGVTFLYNPATVMGIPHWAFKMLITALIATLVMVGMACPIPNHWVTTIVDKLHETNAVEELEEVVDDDGDHGPKKVANVDPTDRDETV